MALDWNPGNIQAPTNLGGLLGKSPINFGGGAGGATNLGGGLGDLGSLFTDWAGKYGAAIDSRNPYVKKDKQDTSQATADYIKSIMPKYNSPLNTNGTLQKPYQVNAGPAIKPQTLAASTYTAGQIDPKALAVNTQALDALRAKGLTTGDSEWAKLAKQEQDQATLAQKDTAGAQALSGASTAQSGLAMGGGLGGGASERIATAASRDMNAARQAAQRANETGKLGISAQDEANKNSILGQVSGQDLANANYGAGLSEFNVNAGNTASQFNAGQTQSANQFNVGSALDAAKFNSGQNFAANQSNATNALGALGGENAFNTGAFQTQITGYGASKTADAIANAGKK